MQHVVLSPDVDFATWRIVARTLALAGVAPDQIVWSSGTPKAPDLPVPPEGAAFSVPRAMVELAQLVFPSNDPGRFDLLYRLIWRLRQGERDLLSHATDPDVRRALALGPRPLAAAALISRFCRACPLWQPAGQTVFGEGPPGAPLMLVGEQPGDQEDLAGRPFVGPAGQKLDQALAELGIDRRQLYVTNAVKHFKFEPRGKRRIHQTPEAGEAEACRFWLDLERREVRPRLTVLLGATAARTVLARPVTISRTRGQVIPLPDGGDGLVTVHPSYLLRLPDEDAKAREYAAFVADLRVARDVAWPATAG